MKMNIKALALDIDGTITDPTRKLCLSAAEAIRKVEKQGIPVIIVTGNILCFTMATSVLLGASGGLVAENGGVVISRDEVKVLGDYEKSKLAFDYLKSKEDVEKVGFSDLRVSEIALRRTVPVNQVKNTLKDFDIEVYDTQFALHLTDPQVNKGSSLELITGELGIKTRDIMAVGDSENDIDFLKVAGLKVAVANGDNELKKMADYVTTKKYGDGVKEAIERFIL